MVQSGERIAAIVIAWNEAEALHRVLPELAHAQLAEIIVVDGGSTDGTPDVARALGARVVRQPGRGYGDACLAGALATDADVLVYLDGDYADDPRDFRLVVQPLLDGRADLVIGARNGPGSDAGALPPHQRIGNRLVCSLIRLLYGVKLADLGSFRAIRRMTLLELQMHELSYGWPVEMVVKAARHKLRIVNVPLRYRRRIGHSKVGGTWRGSLRAGWLMIAVVVRHVYAR